MGREKIESGAATGVKISDRSLKGIVEASGTACVVERNGGARRLNAVIDFGSGGDKAITGQPDASTKHGSRQLKNVGVAQDAGKFAIGAGRRHKGAHRRRSDGDICVRSLDDHGRYSTPDEIYHAG